MVAQALNRADEQSADAARSRFLEFWDREGRHHFQQEEEHLLPAFAAHGDPRHPLVLQVLGDHVAIRSSAASLASTPAPALETLHRLGAELAAHVRLEERELFPVIEDAMPAEELLALAHALDAG